MRKWTEAELLRLQQVEQECTSSTNLAHVLSELSVELDRSEGVVRKKYYSLYGGKKGVANKETTCLCDVEYICTVLQNKSRITLCKVLLCLKALHQEQANMCENVSVKRTVPCAHSLSTLNFDDDLLVQQFFKQVTYKELETVIFVIEVLLQYNDTTQTMYQQLDNKLIWLCSIVRNITYSERKQLIDICKIANISGL